jgi:hypothetical protein
MVRKICLIVLYLGLNLYSFKAFAETAYHTGRWETKFTMGAKEIIRCEYQFFYNGKYKKFWKAFPKSVGNCPGSIEVDLY